MEANKGKQWIYGRGDHVTYRVFTGELRTCVVSSRFADERGKGPGFSGTMNDRPVWGLDSQIVVIGR